MVEIPSFGGITALHWALLRNAHLSQNIWFLFEN